MREYKIVSKKDNDTCVYIEDGFVNLSNAAKVEFKLWAKEYVDLTINNFSFGAESLQELAGFLLVLSKHLKGTE